MIAGSLTISTTNVPGLSPGQVVDISIDDTVTATVVSSVDVTATPTPSPAEPIPTGATA